MTLRLANRLALLLLPLTGILLVAALLVGRQQAGAGEPLSQYGFGVCELPCWAGITPGETTSGFIIPALEKNIPTYQSARFPEGGVVTFRLDGDVGGNIRFYNEVNQIYLIDLAVPVTYLIQKLSTPDCVNADSNAMLLMWNRGDNVIVSTFVGDPARILSGQDANTTSLMVFEGGANFCQHYPLWRGFAPLWFYQRESEKR